ncbi:outer membrane beta-barrel protein [Joostella sp. CR20]|uniref:outer membrane beta-barrel protein n=1 Tax=Joostella sp. CR20 TaxID=2804312 RepID=UPI00313B7DC7
MKNFITAMFALAIFGTASAQEAQLKSELKSAVGMTFEKGDMFVEGSIKISTGGDQDYYGFNPKFGYFLNNKWAVGGEVSYANNKVETLDSKTSVFGVGGFARYYFLELAKKRLKAYGEAGLGYGRNKTEIGNIEDISNSITADLNLGLNYFFTKNFAATFTLANVLSYNSVSPEDGASSNTFELNINLFENIFEQPQFGILYKF